MSRTFTEAKLENVPADNVDFSFNVTRANTTSVPRTVFPVFVGTTTDTTPAVPEFTTGEEKFVFAMENDTNEATEESYTKSKPSVPRSYGVVVTDKVAVN
jgi:hypothetical protein